MRIAVLVSGGGSNLQSLIDNASDCYELVLVISDRQHAFGLERAKKHGIDACYVGLKNFGDAKNDEILRLLTEYRIDAVVLAGYLSILPDFIVNKFEHKIINIHPSLIPSFCGMGFYGHKVHEAVFKTGVKITGATVHFVNAGIDTGEIILQESVAITDETPEEIAKKVLVLEHRLLPHALNLLCNNKIKTEHNRTIICE